MPGSPPTSPVFGAPRYVDGDDASFSTQVNSVTDTFDGLAVRTDDGRMSDQRVPLDGSVTLAKIPNASITGSKLAAQTITQGNLAPASVGSAEIIDGSIANVDLSSNSVDTRVIAAGGVSTPNIGDGQVTAPKLSAAAQQALNAPGDLIFSAAGARVGAVLCDGKAYSRTDPTYAALFAAIATTYGGGDGSTTFNVPNYLGRAIVAAGQGAGLTNRALGSLFGEEAHSLSVYEMPAHAHGVSDPTHAHSVSDPTHAHAGQAGYALIGTQSGGSLSLASMGPQAGHTPAIITNGPVAAIITDARATGIGIYGSATGIGVQTNGNSGAHNVCQPSAAVNVFIKL